MKNNKLKIFKCILSMLIIFSFIIPANMLVYATQNRTSYYSRSFTLSGNGADDIISVARAQIGKTGAQLGYSEEWCADFVSDCAALANQSTAIPRDGYCPNLQNKILNAGGRSVSISSAQKGDIAFYGSGGASHVEIVYANNNGRISTIGGNSGSGGSCYARSVRDHSYQTMTITKVLRPNYGQTPAILPGTLDTSWNVPANVTAGRRISTYDQYGNVESNRYIDAGDRCYISEIYTNGFVKIQYPVSGGTRWSYAKASEFSLEKKIVSATILPGTIDTSWNVPANVTAGRRISTYDQYGNVESNRYIDAGDRCYISEIYTNGFVKIQYPVSGGTRWSYAKASEFSLEKKYVLATILPGTLDTSWNVPANVTAGRRISTYDQYGNVESNRYIDAGDRCYISEIYTNGFVKIQYPVSGGKRWSYAKASEFSLEKKYVPAAILPGTLDTSWNVPANVTAGRKISTYDQYGNVESNHYIDPGDYCYISEVYTNGFVKIKYPVSGGTRWAYAKVSDFSLVPKQTETQKGSCTHVYGSWRTVNKATCTTDGSEQRICSICGKTETRTTKATGHKYTDKVVEPTTAQQGYTLHTCTNCGHSYKDSYTDADQSQNEEITTENSTLDDYVTEEDQESIDVDVEETYEVGDEVSIDEGTFTITRIDGIPSVEYTLYDDDATEVNIPKTITVDGVVYRVTTVAPKAFYKNTSVKKVIIPATVTEIGSKAFYGCESLKEVYILSTKMKSGKIGSKAFMKLPKNVKIYVPQQNYKTYKKLLKKAGVSSKAKIYWMKSK